MHYEEKTKTDTDYSIGYILILVLTVLVIGSVCIDFLLNFIGKTPQGVWKLIPMLKAIFFHKISTQLGVPALVFFGIKGIFDAKNLRYILSCWAFAIAWYVFYLLQSKL